MPWTSRGFSSKTLCVRAGAGTALPQGAQVPEHHQGHSPVSRLGLGSGAEACRQGAAHGPSPLRGASAPCRPKTSQPGAPGQPAGQLHRACRNTKLKQAAPAPGTRYLQGLELREGNWKPEPKKEVAWSHLNSPLPNPQVNPQLDLDTHILTLLFPSSNSTFAARPTAASKAGKECCIKKP